jgi:hypothetical protein
MNRIFADTNVLFPFSIMGLLLALSEDGLHELLWTDELLDEWEAEYPDEVAGTIVRLAREKKRPPKSVDDLLNDLEHAGVPHFVTRMSALRGTAP